MSGAVLMSLPSVDESREWLGIDNQSEATEPEITKACHRKFLMLHPIGDRSSAEIKEENLGYIRAAYGALVNSLPQADATPRSSEFAKFPEAREDTPMRGGVVVAHRPTFGYQRPMNEGQPESGVELRPVYAWWLRGSPSENSTNTSSSEGAWGGCATHTFCDPRVVEATDPIKNRFRYRESYYGKPDPVKQDDSEDEDMELDEMDLEEEPPTNTRSQSRGMRDEPRGRRRER